MKKFLIIMSLVSSVAASADTITLRGGESIYINNTVVRCEGSVQPPMPVGNARFADLPWTQLLTLLEKGLGSCQIRYTSGSNREPFFYSPYYNALHVGPNTYNIVRGEIRKGNCD